MYTTSRRSIHPTDVIARVMVWPVAIVPGEAFGAPGYARLSFALADDQLVEGVSRLAELLSSAR